jgi:hypothetical protein
VVAKVCIVNVGVYLGLRLLRVMAAASVMLLWFLLPLRKTRKQVKGLNALVTTVVELFTGVGVACVSFAAQSLASIVYSLYAIYPLLMLCVMLAVLHDQYGAFMQMFVESYNRFVTQNTVVVFFRNSLWIAKLAWEMLIPLYTYGIHVLAGMQTEVLKALFFQDETRATLFSVFAGLGSAVMHLSTAAAEWVQRDYFGCRYSAIADAMAGEGIHPCMSYGPGKFRSLALGDTVRALQSASAQGMLLVVNLCPAVTSFATALVYPLYDARVPAIAENLLNLVIGGLWTVWDVTHSRCRNALAQNMPSTLCVPDVAPLFHFAHQIVIDVGALLDNWANIVHVVVMKFFMDRDDTVCARGNFDVLAVAGDGVLASGAETRLVALTPRLLAMTDGASVVFSSAHGQGDRQQRAAAFHPAVNVLYGLAPVEYGNSVQHADAGGDTTTGLMGCTCNDTISVGVVLECQVVLYERIYDPASTERYRRRIPVVFERAGGAQLLRCADLRISVQAVRFPRQQYDYMPTGFYGDRPNAQRPPLVDCLVDPDKCNDVDALVYVTPVCSADGATLGCLAALRDNVCFPYCVGLHQRRVGSFPVTLYSERTLSAGVYMTNMDCSPERAYAASPDTAFEASTTATTSEDFPGDNVERTPAGGTRDCAPSPVHNSLLVPQSAAWCQGQDGLCQYQHIADRPRVVVDQLQPAVIAGDALLVPHCNPGASASECVWTSTVLRLTGDVRGQYSLRPTVTGVPSMRAQPEGSELRSVLFLPRQSMDYRKWYSPAAQTATGIAYALNPDIAPIECLLTATGCTQIIARAQYMRPRVFLTAPTFECAVGTSVQMASGVAAKLCSANLTREVAFTGPDRFWSYADPKALERDIAEGVQRNLFVEDVAHFDDLNVAVAVRRGRLTNLLYEAGRGPLRGERHGGTVYYFVNTRTLEVRRDRAWPSPVASTEEATYGMLCPGDTIVPPFASAIASYVAVLLKISELVVNQFVLNFVGVLESMAASRAQDERLCVRGAQGHYAFHPCAPGPFSIAPVYAVFLGLHARVLTCTQASLGYISYLTQIPLSEHESSQGGAYAFAPTNLHFTAGVLQGLRASLAAGVGVVAQTAVTSFYGVVFVYEHIALPYVHALIQRKFGGNLRETLVAVAYTLSNTVHDAVASNALSDTLMLPAEQSCLSLAMLTGDSNRPVGVVVHHSCLALFEGAKSALRLGPAVITLSSITTCVCAQEMPLLGWAGVVNVDGVCSHMIPSGLRAQYQRVFAQTRSANAGDSRAYHEELCATLVNRMGTVIAAIPSPMFQHLGLAASAMGGVPQQLAALLNIPGMQGWSCGSYSSDIGVIAIVPQPVRAYAKCAYTRTCRAQCAESIDWFAAELANSHVTTKAAAQGSVRFELQVPAAAGPLFRPLLVQDYGARANGCRRWVAVLAEELEGPAGHSMRFLCQSAVDPAIFEYSPAAATALPMLAEQGFEFGRAGAARTVYEMWLLPPPEAMPSVAAVLLLAARYDDAQDGLYEVVVLDDQTARARWVARAHEFVHPYSPCPQVRQSIGDFVLARTDSVENVADIVLGDSSAEAPVRFHKVMVVPRPAAAGYVLYALLRGQVGLLTRAALLPFRVLLSLTRVAPGDEAGVLVCSASVFSTHADSLAQFLQIGMRDRAMFSSPAAHLVSFGMRTAAEYDAVFHDVRVVFDRERKVDMLLLTNNGTVACGDAAGMAGLMRLTDNRRRAYIQGRAGGTEQEHAGTHLALPLQAAAVFSLLASSSQRLSDTGGWLPQLVLDAASPAAARALQQPALPGPGTATGLTATRHLAPTENFEASVRRVCDYMDCAGCASLELQRSCYQAQRCALTNCVGTVVNVNNVMCVVGGLAQKIQAFNAFEAQETWLLGVELLMGVLRKWALGQTRDGDIPVNIIGLSSMLVTRTCGLKDIVAHVAALLPTLYYTIYVGMLGGDASRAPTSAFEQQFVVVREGITPLLKLQTTEIVTASTALIFQFMLVVVNLRWNLVRVALCIVDEFASLTSGQINIVVNTIGEDRGFCLGDKDDGAEDALAESDNEMLQRVILQGSLSPQSQHATISSSESLDAVDYTTTATGALLWKTKMPKLMLLSSITTLIDWVIGLTHGLARVAMATQDAACAPQASYAEGVLDCVCGDRALDVSEPQRSHHAGDGGLWCSGVLRMVTTQGELTYVHNALSFGELTAALNARGEMRALLACISSSPADACAAEQRAVDAVQQAAFAAHDVSPVSVLTRCRENYASKTWDDGLFAVYNRVIRASVLVAGLVGEETLDLLKTQIDAFVQHDGGVIACLQDGPEFNTMQQCMALHFAAQGARTGLSGRYAAAVLANANSISGVTPQAPASLNRMEYFAYSHRPAQSSASGNADACQWGSAAALSAGVAAHCSSGGQQCRNGMLLNPTTCSLNMVQATASAAGTSNPVAMFMVEEPSVVHSEADIAARYEVVRTCTHGYIDAFVTGLKTLDTLAGIQYDLVSFEGDTLHQYADCVVLGPDSSVDLMPSDDALGVEQMAYSRGNTSEATCQTHTLTNTADDTEVSRGLPLCGTGPRIAALAYIKRDLLAQKKAASVMQSLIYERIEHIRGEVGRLERFGCAGADDVVGWQQCCPGGVCASFAPAALDIDTRIPIQDILAALEIDSVQAHALQSTP